MKTKKSQILTNIVAVVMLALAAFVVQDANASETYCSGYQDGYAAGYCYGTYQCQPPQPPICPQPEVGRDGYQAGYNDGFIQGQRAR